jgi:CPA1 family monovalent cation:H+ antiporter
LGAIVSPTDTVAASAIAQRLVLPRRLTAVLSDESIVNDATALVIYTTAVATVTQGSFSFLNAGLDFFKAGIGGVILGLVVAWCIGQIRRYLHDPPVENTLSLLSGFAAYIPATALGLSGVLAILAMGMYLGRKGPSVVSSQTRIQAEQVWEIVVFLLNGLIFILIGLQLNSVLAKLTETSVTTLIWDAVIISLTVILTRLIWVFPGSYLPRFLSRRIREKDPYPSWQTTLVLGWTGMRGGVSLATALALPLVIHGKTPFPDRDIIVFLTFSVILSTLVLQGLTLPPLIQGLKLPDDGSSTREEAKARLKAARVALARLDELSAEEWVEQEMIDDLRLHFSDQDRRFTAQYQGTEDGVNQEQKASVYQRLKIELISAERHAIIELRNQGVINDEVMRKIQRDLDLEELRLQP